MNLRGRAAGLVALLGYSAGALALFSNTWAHPTTRSVGVFGDPQQFMWFLSWPPFAVAHGINPLFTDYIDYPAGVNLMWNASELLPALVLSPITQVGGFVLAYNLLMTSALALSAWTAFIFIRRYVPSPLPAAVGGALYGFSPFMTAQSLGHPHVTVAFMPPVLFLLLDEVVRVQRRPALLSGSMLGVAAAAQLLIGEELLATTAVVGLLLVCIAAGLCIENVAARVRHAALGLVSGGAVFGVLAALPVGYQFFGPQRLHGAVQAPNTYVSDALGFLVPTRLMLVSPGPAARLADRFSGANVVENNAYVGVVLAALLLVIAVRCRRRLDVRLAALGATLIAILSMGVTIHVAGRATAIPVFAIGLVFPLLQRFLPGRVMLYLTFLGWLGLSRLPVLTNVLPSRLMLYFYLLAGLLLAVLLEDLPGWKPAPRVAGWLASAAALLLLVPALPYPTTENSFPVFFTGDAVSQIPTGSVALLIPYSVAGDGRAMAWQARAGMRFRMPEGYAFIPDAPPSGWRLSPPASATFDAAIAVAQGRPAGAVTDAARQLIREELRSWRVSTVIVGPMDNEQQEVDLFTSILGQPPQQVDGVFVWWGVDSYT